MAALNQVPDIRHLKRGSVKTVSDLIDEKIEPLKPPAGSSHKPTRAFDPRPASQKSTVRAVADQGDEKNRCSRLLGRVAEPSMCRPVSLPAKAIGASTRRPVRLRECKLSPAPNGAVLIWLMVQDIGYNRSGRRKSVDCCCNSFADEEKPTSANRSVEPVLRLMERA
jgi:hypothetical protein